jgi:3(or 17)beta-hydroxysteroid dehydrogenase
MGRVEGKIAIVTGAASGIGLATARLLAREGAQVVLTDVNATAGAAAAAALGARFRALDVRKPEEWTAVVDGVVAELGRLDVLINNAGVGVMADIERATLAEWRFVHAVNTEGVFLGCQNAVRVMKRSGGGSIVNVSSIAGIVAAHNLPAYCSSKAGVRLLTKSVALHCAREGYKIRCNSVHPSFIATPMVDAMVQHAQHGDKMREQLENAAPLGHLGEPDDVAYMILYLASDESKFVTAAELIVDGGTTAR